MRHSAISFPRPTHEDIILNSYYMDMYYYYSIHSLDSYDEIGSFTFVKDFRIQKPTTNTYIHTYNSYIHTYIVIHNDYYYSRIKYTRFERLFVSRRPAEGEFAEAELLT